MLSLLLDVALYHPSRDVPSAAHIERGCPQMTAALAPTKPGKLLQDAPGRYALQYLRHVRGCPLGRHGHEDVGVVGHDLHAQNYPVPHQAGRKVRSRVTPEYLHQLFPHCAMKKMPAILGGEHKMVVQVVMRMACSALLGHMHMIAYPLPTMLCAPSEHVGESMYPRFGQPVGLSWKQGDYSSPTPPLFSNQKLLLRHLQRPPRVLGKRHGFMPC